MSGVQLRQWREYSASLHERARDDSDWRIFCVRDAKEQAEIKSDFEAIETLTVIEEERLNSFLW